MTAWTDEGASTSVVGGRFRALRACLAWAYNERLIDTHPLRLMRGAARPKPLMPLADEDVHALL